LFVPMGAKPMGAETLWPKTVVKVSPLLLG
jgi:hypothetical protein